jgi:hypothetical protein
MQTDNVQRMVRIKNTPLVVCGESMKGAIEFKRNKATRKRNSFLLKFLSKVLIRRRGIIMNNNKLVEIFSI